MLLPPEELSLRQTNVTVASRGEEVKRQDGGDTPVLREAPAFRWQGSWLEKEMRGKSPPPSKRRVLGLLSGLVMFNFLSPARSLGDEHVAFQFSGQLTVPRLVNN